MICLKIQPSHAGIFWEVLTDVWSSENSQEIATLEYIPSRGPFAVVSAVDSGTDHF
jgi:hypothetical protein